jgi:O-methyltransferase domain
MRQLKSTNFRYPFRERETPTQFGYRMLGASYADDHTYSIMHHQGRMPSFNAFMEGKFGKFGTMPERVKGLGYDLDSVINGARNEFVMVDVGGGRGGMLREVLREYPHLKPSSLLLQDYHPEVETDELTVMHWDFKDGSPQPVRGAHVYSLTHIYHNLPDLDALELMLKIADAMNADSRMLIHEFPKNSTYGKMHATMIDLFAGRIRSSREWKKLAVMAGLQITFEAYPVAGMLIKVTC